jgi:ATP synthase protein I
LAEFYNGKSPGDPGQGADKSDLADFSARLRQTQKAHIEPEERSSRGTSMGIAFRLTTELVAGLVVGGGIGLLLDKWLGTGPVFLLIFFVLGMAAGILNVFRTAKQLAAQAERSAGGNPGGSPK